MTRMRGSRSLVSVSVMALGATLAACSGDGGGGAPDAARPVPDVGVERDLGEPDAGPPARCASAADCPALPPGSCALVLCDTASGRCVWTAPDGDADGVADARCEVPLPPEGGTVMRVVGTDCDDSDPERRPTAVERCDSAGHDEDCDPRTVAGPAPDGDADGDGYVSVDCVNRDEVGEISGSDCAPEDPAIHPGADEQCNGLDDDCDGTADPAGCACIEDQPCGPAVAATSDPAICRRGIQRCTGGVLGACEGAVYPTAEACDAARLDEDCDGVSNEPEVCECDDGQSRLCGGAPDGMHHEAPATCRRGTQMCSAGRWGACAGEVAPSIEACDAAMLDEDCDGERNEGCGCTDGATQPCGGDPGGHNMAPAVCRTGTQTCTGGVWGACSGDVAPGVEICDGRDDEDCDGMLDEGCECVTGMMRPCGGGPVNGGFSVCHQGSQRCIGGTWGACEGGVSPGVEVCDVADLDEDCDGQRDEGCELVQIGAGNLHSCARRANGEVLCWGASGLGQLGNGGWDRSTTPVSPGITDATALSVGAIHNCVLHPGGTVSCWGTNRQLQISGTLMESAAWRPYAIPGLSGVLEVSAGYQNTCVQTAAREVQCWGANGSGQLGNGTTSTTPVGTPTPVHLDSLPLESTIFGITTGDGPSACATVGTTTFGLFGGYCWGAGAYGQLGNDGTMSSSTPVRVSTYSSSGPIQMEMGFSHACAALTDGTAACWGRNDRGQIGDGTTTNQSRPFVVPGLDGVRKAVAGNGYSCALLHGGSVYCWGDNYLGFLGDGTTEVRSSPTLVVGLTDAVDLAAGNWHTCAVRVNGTAVCWGDNIEGQLGDGTLMQRNAPVPVMGIP